MPITLTPNLHLLVDSTSSAASQSNLLKLDALGSTFLVDTTQQLLLRSRGAISIIPNSADLGGSGVGGTVNIGSPSQPVTLNLYTSTFLFSGGISLADVSPSAFLLNVEYLSDLPGTPATADRTLAISLADGNRNLQLGGDLAVLGGNVSLTGPASVVLPLTGTLATLAGTETLTGKTISGSTNTISNLAYSSLVLGGSIQASDIAPAAGIPYSKLTLTGSIVGADVSPTAAIPYSKLSLTAGIVNADVSASAAIAGAKVSPDFGNQQIRTTNLLEFSSGGFNTQLGPATGGQAADIHLKLPPDLGSPGQVLAGDGAGNTSWTTALTFTSELANTVLAGPASGPDATPTFRALVVADMPSGVAIRSTHGTWTSGTSFSITHNWGSQQVRVEVLDIAAAYATIEVDAVTRPDGNTVSLMSNTAAPGTGWLVLLSEVG